MSNYISKSEQATAEFKDLMLTFLHSPKETIFPIKELENIFNKIFFLLYLAKRFETKTIILNNYYEVSVSFIIEGFITLSNGIPNGSLFLLRSAIENFTKSILSNEHGTINERSYAKNHNELLRLISNDSLLTDKKEKILTKLQKSYGTVSAISHSATNISEFTPHQYFIDILKIDNDGQVIKSWNTILENLCEYATYQCQPSFKYWNYWELVELLELVFSRRKSQKIAEFLIDNKEF